MNMVPIDQIENQIKSLGRDFGRLNVNKEEISFGRERAFAMQIIRKSDMLQDCDPQTIREAVMNVAFVGLSLNPAHGYAYLVPMRDNKRGLECQLMIGYKGMIKQATASTVVRNLAADVVHQNDYIDLTFGDDPSVVHKIDPRKRRGDAIGAYCLTTLATGDKQLEWMDREQIMKAREVAKTKAVWDGPFGLEQWRKTVIRRASKRWPKDAAIEHLNEIMDRFEPADFGQPSESEKARAESKEPTVCLTDDQITELHAMVTDYEIDAEKANRWLSLLAQSKGYPSIESTPKDLFEDLKATLSEKLKEWKAKQ